MTRSAFSRSHVKSGRIKSTPRCSESGNISPQSSSRIWLSSSNAAQLRPISPSPPRKVMRTCSATQVLQDLAGAILEAVRARSDGRASRTGRKVERAQHRLRRDGVGVEVAALEHPTLEQASVELAGGVDVALLERGDHL